MERCPSKYTKDILIIEDILHQWGQVKKANQNSSRKSKIDSDLDPMNGQKEEPLLVEPFAAAHRLCRFFPCVQFKLKDDKNNKAPTFMARPSFSFPFVKPPNMIPNVDETLLHSEFGGARAASYLP